MITYRAFCTVCYPDQQMHNIYEGESKIKAIFKLRGNRDREGLSHCAVLTMPIE